ncbi:MAG: glycosyltransferase family 2 protein [Cytophagaceae bacterium]
MLRSLSVIIPNYNGEKLLTQFLPSVINALETYKGEKELIIVDDKSSDNSREIMENFASATPFIKNIYNSKNLGFSGTCNVGMYNSKGNILCFLNNDVEVNLDFFQNFNYYFDLPSTFAVTISGYSYIDRTPLDGAKLLDWKRGLPRFTGNIYPKKVKKDFLYESASVQGAYFFADRFKILRLKGFDEIFSPYLIEDSDLAYRAIKSGWKIYYDPFTIAFHNLSSTIKRENSGHKKIIDIRNRIIFVLKNVTDKRLLFKFYLFLAFRLLTLSTSYFKAIVQILKIKPELKKARQANPRVLTDKFIFEQYTDSGIQKLWNCR